MTSLANAVSAALIQFVWQGALVALLFSVLLVALKRSSPQSRYIAGCMALLVLAVLPIVSVWILYLPVPPLAGMKPASQVARDWTLPAWAIGALLFSLRPVWNLAHVYALRRKGAQPETWIADLASSVAKRMGCARAFRILMSAISKTPAVVGWMRPVILLPAATVAGLTVAQLETVLAHEIAHIRRHDYLINILQVMVETLLFYHPAVWWISSRIRLERELCCDDEVVRTTGDALCYSRALTLLERLRAAEPAVAVGSTGGPLSYRIRRLVGVAPPSRESWPATQALAITLALTLICVTIGVTWARARQESDTVTVEITRDKQLAIISVRVVSGPAYLRQLALRAALGVAPQQMRVQTLTFPAAFVNLSRTQQKVVENLVHDELADAELAVRTITGDSPEDQRKLRAAKERLAELQRKQSLVRGDLIARSSPEREWKVQVLAHQVEQFREEYQGKLAPGTNPALEAQYTQLQQALDSAMKDLAAVGAP